MRWLIWIAVVAAWAGCGDARVLFQIHGDVGPVSTLELIAAEPIAVEKLQRTNDPQRVDQGLERVYYVAQRTQTSIEIAGGKLDGFELQVALGDDEPYLPILVARAGGRIVGIGVYAPQNLLPPPVNIDPPKLWSTDAVQYRGDVTVYPIAMEPATQIDPLDGGDTPTPVHTGEVLDVGCDGAMSGLVWRRDEGLGGSNRQLRIMVPVASGELDARARLERGPDLDCDSHTPVTRFEDGDKLDCDDTTPTTFATAEETCNGIDDNCDGQRGGIVATGNDPACATACSPVGVCNDAAPEVRPICAAACLTCLVPQEPDLSGGGERACRAEAQLKPPNCDAGCVVTLVGADPRWNVRIGPRGNPQNGVQQPFVVQNIDDLAVVVESATVWAPTDLSGGVFLLFVQPQGGFGYLVSFDLDLSLAAGGECDGVTKSMNCQ